MRECIKDMQTNYSHADIFKQGVYKKFVTMTIGDPLLSDTVEKVLSELATLYVIRKDLAFRSLFEIEKHTIQD
jgi:hypothetical protein